MRILNASGTPNLSGLLARIRAGIHRSITGNDTFKCKSQSVNGPFFAIHAMSNFAGVKLCLEPAQQAQIHRKSKTTHPAAVRGDLCTRYQTTALAPTWLLGSCQIRVVRDTATVVTSYALRALSHSSAHTQIKISELIQRECARYLALQTRSSPDFFSGRRSACACDLASTPSLSCL